MDKLNILTSIVVLLIIAVLFLLYDKFYNKNQSIVTQKFSGIPSSYVDVLGGNIQPTPSPGNVSLVYSADTSGNLVTLNTMPLIPQGTIVAFYGTFAPAGWVFCDGKKYDKVTGALQLDTTPIGGDIIQTPDLRGRFVLGYVNDTVRTVDSGLTKRDIYTKGGAETHTLDITQIPPHDHRILQGDQFFNSGGGTASWGSLYGSLKTEKTGGLNGLTQPHNNMPPFQVLSYIFKL